MTSSSKRYCSPLDWNSESGEDDGDCEGCDDEVEFIDTTSPATESDKSILYLPERNEENTGWLFPEGINPVSVLNKMKAESIPTVFKHKEMFVTEVVKNDSVVVQWMWDKVNQGTWDKNLATFPHGKKCMPQHKWM